MKTAFIVILSIVAALALPFVIPLLKPGSQPVSTTSASAEDNRLLPWNITVRPDGSTEIFGLTPGASTLPEAIRQFGQNPEVAIIGLRDQAGSLEAFFDSVRLGPLTGKMIVTLRATGEQLQGMRQRAIKSEYMESAVLRATLAPEDLAQAQHQPIDAIVFVPAARLDETIILERFGPPVERRSSAGEIEHFLYPALGLDIALSSRGKAQLQYVAPRDFARVRAPLADAPAS